jgi:hypothetical protein
VSRRETRDEAFEREVSEIVGNFEALEGVKLHPWVSRDGSKFTTVALEADFPGGVQQFLERNSHWNVLTEELREETKSDGGRAVLLEAYRRFQDEEE